MEEHRYPIGRLSFVDAVTPAMRREWIDEIRRAPVLVREAVAGLDDAQLDTPYREGGWTVRQVVHHLPDSHANAFVRFRWTLTEEQPTIKDYDERAWAELPDARSAPVGPSLDLLAALHGRWALLLEEMDEADFRRTLVHPDRGVVDLDVMLQIYAWHGRHHAAQVTSLRDRSGWNG